MPKFVSEQHRKNWIASIRKAKAKRRDMLTAGANLGRKEVPLPHKQLNGGVASALAELRGERVRATDRVSRIEAAISAIEALKA